MFIPDKRMLRRDHVTFYNCLKAGSHTVDAGLFSQIAHDRSGPKLHGKKFRLGIMKNFFTKRVVKHWNRMSMDVV